MHVLMNRFCFGLFCLFPCPLQSRLRSTVERRNLVEAARLRASVPPHVRGQLVPPRGAVLAIRAGVGPLAGVRAHVLGHVGLVLCGKGAVLFGARKLPRRPLHIGLFFWFGFGGV